MTGVLAILSVLMGALGVSAMLRLQFIHALPATVLSMTFGLYLAYILGFLHLAWWGVVASCLLAGIAGFVVRARDQSFAKALVPAPSVVSFLIAMFIVAYFVAGRHVAGHDELRLWGAYPKLLFFDGQLLVGPDSLLMGEMQTYTPGLPLFGFFTASFSATFSDEPLFLATGLFTLSLLSPIAGRASWQRPASIVVAGVVMALVPLAFANHLAEAGADFYSSLFSDPVVGVALGYLLWLATTDTDRTRLWCAQFGLALAGLYLVKTTGLGLGVIVLLLALGRWFRSSRGHSWPSRLTDIVLLTGPLAITMGSWMFIQARLGPPSKFDADGLVPALDAGVLHDFAAMLLGRPEYAPGLGMFQAYTSFAVLDAALLVALGYLVLAHRGGRSRVLGAAVVTLLVCQLVFMAGIYVLVVGPFDGRFLSFPRYTATMLTAASVLLVLVAASNPVPESTRLDRWTRAFACSCAAFLLLSFPLRAPITFVGGWEQPAAVQANKLGIALGQVRFPEELPVVTLLFPLDSLDPVGHHHGVYYQLLGSNVRVDLRQPLGAPASGVDTEGVDESLPAYKQNVPSPEAEFRQYILDNNVRFVMVAQETPVLLGQYADWFDRPPHADSLYRVSTDGDQIQFMWVA